ncbi:MAG: NAD(P)H-dependent oxidoreductase [Bacteroidota bacterium]
MTKHIVAFGASNSKESINKQFAQFAAKQLQNVEVSILDLNDFELPLYSVDLEKAYGIPANARKFLTLIKNSDGIILSLAEYNGLHTSAFKNLWDWLSRIPMDQPRNIWGNKPMFLLSTSPSRRPMNNVLKLSKEIFPHFGANIIADFYLPSFHRFYRNGHIIEPGYVSRFTEAKKIYQDHLDSLA